MTGVLRFGKIVMAEHGLLEKRRAALTLFGDDETLKSHCARPRYGLPWK